MLVATLVAAGCSSDGDGAAPVVTAVEERSSSTASAATTTTSTTSTTTTTTSTTSSTTTTMPPEPAELDVVTAEAAMDEFLATTGSPGVLAGVRVGEQDPVLLARGIDDTDVGTEMQPDRMFRVGSVSTALRAAVLFEAVDAGRLSLADPIGNYVDGVTNPDATIEQVLSHDAGLADWDALGDSGIRGLLVADLERDWAPTEIVEEVKALPAVSEPGSGFSYSNPGYQMLGAVVEQVNGEPFAASLRRVLADGSGLDDISFGPFDEIPENLVHSYGDLGGNLVPSRALPAVGIDSLFYTTGAGYSDLDDLLEFSRLFWGDEAAFSPDGVDVAADLSGGYGLATQFIGDELVGHSGDVFGSRTLVAHHRALDVTIVVNANTNVLERADTVDRVEALLAAIG